ncbi:hypothetical protein A1OE_1310 [Candidatus Endolissoclinum faulkneri L2]|uniref:Uncharacterized protein n=1 Tax=Candidatus Endolissoclinum faulkneri L2 TaxID=1193729 RepID=K7Z5W7_9PROT|nr:hypothetical protein A1OE_1310 [Candidatus Endolissoclinum faulkneri L2]
MFLLQLLIIRNNFLFCEIKVRDSVCHFKHKSFGRTAVQFKAIIKIFLL